MSSTEPSRSLLGRRAADGPRAGVRDLLPYLREHRRMLVVVVLLSLVGAVASLAQPAIVSQVIGLVQKGQPLGALVWGLAALVVVAGLLSGAQHYLLERTGISIVLTARQRLVRRMFRLPIAEFDVRRHGDLVSRVGSDTTLLFAVMTQGLVDSIGGAIVFIGAIIGMAIIDPVLLGLTVLVIAVAIVAVGGIGRGVRAASRAQQDAVGGLAAAVERVIGAIRTVRAANATERETAEVEKHAQTAYLAGVKVARFSALIVPVAGIAMQLSFLVVLGVGGYRVASGAITIANLVAFILFLFMMIMPLGQAFGAFTSVNQALGALGRIHEIIAIPSEEETRSGTPAAARPSGAALAFDDVRFGYAASSPEEPAREVLHGVSFDVPRGARVALVGPSGAGKSTILALIERFYDPDSGVVRLDGRDIRALDRHDLRALIGYVEQDAPALAGSLRDNLKLSAPDATDDDCAAVLRSVNLGEVLDRSEGGLDAQVGENGVMLSGGERQRLAIARALLASPPILLLDEATASLDGRNEQLLRDAIGSVAADRTLLVIAHRLSTVVDSDSIVVLDQGRVIGVGTHDELLASTPLYRELAAHQLLV